MGFRGLTDGPSKEEFERLAERVVQLEIQVFGSTAAHAIDGEAKVAK